MRLLHRLPRPRLRRETFGTSKYPRKLPAKTLYDLLCVGPDDDAETLQGAFRHAAKAHHPDLNPGDPDAPRRFRQIVTAYGILRDVEKRGGYDRLLTRERARRRAERMRTIVSGTVAIAAFTVVMVGGYTLFAQLSKTSVEAAKVVKFAAREPADMTAVQPTTRAGTADRDQLSKRLLTIPETVAVPGALTSSMNGGSPPAIADGRPAGIHVLEPAAPTDINHRGEPSGKSTRVALADAPIVPGAVAPEAKSSGALIIASAVSSGSETRLHVRAKPPATDRASVRQAAVESRDVSQVALESGNTSRCASSCSDRTPPLFGVGF